MGITLKQPTEPTDDRGNVTRRLSTLSDREREICLLHFIDGRTQTLVAEWLGITRMAVIKHIESAIKKVPELIPLRRLAQEPAAKIKVYHLSQLPRRDRERGPFNIDEL